MNYLTLKYRGKITNEPMEISLDDIHQMYLQSEADAEECKRVTDSTNRGESYYANDGRPGNYKIKDTHLALAMEYFYRDTKTSGFLVEYPHGLVIQQGEHNSYFRGENKIYQSSIPSVFRTMEKYDRTEDRELYKLVADMKVAEFGVFLFELGITQFWQHEYGDVLFEPLAQHYGLETDWLDITSNFMVALFFATCRWNGKEWRPLTKEETEVSEESQYGFIFHVPQHQTAIAKMRSSLNPNKDINQFKNIILPIGYQPFMRCQSQNAYGIQMKTPFPLQEDSSFEKLFFRHNEKLSQAVFEKMNGGKKIFPQEGLNEFQDIIDEIKNAKTFSEEAFNYAFEKNDYFKERDVVIDLLKRREIFGEPVEIEGNNHPFKVSRQRIRHINMKYKGFSFEKAYGIKISCRSPYTIEKQKNQ